MMQRRRTMVLCRPDTPGREIGRLAIRYNLDIVYTVFTDTESTKLAAMIAVQHLVEHNVEVLVIPYLAASQISLDRQWQAVVAAAHIIAADGPLNFPPPDREVKAIPNAP
ncbi:hypothetical protein [Nocardia sp. CA-290969]|uniref:hypothetical protein n=1 Tax=Nocardia sp. CA-290969 TaxID=3239986 RepID=UPI003D8D8C63